MKLKLVAMFVAMAAVCAPVARGQAALGIKLNKDAAVLEVHPGSAAEKAGLKVGDVITGLNNQSISGGMAEVQATLAKTRPGSLLPVTIKRGGHPQTLLAFPSAAPDAKAPPAEIAPATGHYNCSTFTFTAGMIALAPSSLGTGIDLLPGGNYETLKIRGRFHADAASDRLVFDSGPLAKSVAHLKRDTNGKPKILFAQNENQRAMDGHEIDHGPTGCYLK